MNYKKGYKMFLAYCRVSTEEQAKTHMLSEQERKIRALALMRGCEPYEFASYVDDGVSGSIPLAQRPAGKRILDDAGKGDTIVAAKLDRLFRSCSDALVTIEALAKRDVKVILLDMGTDSLTENGIGKFFFSILAAAAEFERGRIAERTEEGRQAKKRAGGCIGGVPYGWRKVGEGKLSMLVEDREEQDILTLVLRMRRGKKSPSYIARKLTEMGVLSRVGKAWQAVQIDRMSRLAWRAEKARA